jgi:hypothetical protein
MITRITKDKICVGDILFVESVKVDGSVIGSRPFVVWSRNSLIPVQIMMYEISSRDKVGEEYPYNIPILKSSMNGLNQDSHVKADQLFIYCENNMSESVRKFGELELDKYADLIIEKANRAISNHDYYFYDQSNNGKKLIGWD